MGSRVSNEHKILIDSLGNAALGMLGETVELVRVRHDEYLGTATVAIVLRLDTWENRIAALRTCESVQEMFSDDLVIDFVFEDRGEPSRSHLGDQQAFAYAAG
jgi:hypothetical protein